MKKLFSLFLFILTFEQLGIPRLSEIRRINENTIQQDHQYNSTFQVVILKSLSNWDINQVMQNEGRLFIRGVIIHQ